MSAISPDLHGQPEPSSRSSLPEEAPADQGGAARAPLVSSFGNHRVANGRCVDCGLENVQPWHRSYPCDDARPVCESCRQHPASVEDHVGGRRFLVCGSCRSGGDVDLSRYYDESRYEDYIEGRIAGFE